jgi:hypothetical protein
LLVVNLNGFVETKRVDHHLDSAISKSKIQSTTLEKLDFSFGKICSISVLRGVYEGQIDAKIMQKI